MSVDCTIVLLQLNVLKHRAKVGSIYKEELLFKRGIHFLGKLFPLYLMRKENSK